MNRQRGLTLIELTVAGAVTALLGTVLTATLSQTAEQARSAKCQSNLKQVIGAVGMYTADHNGYLPGPLQPRVYRRIHTWPTDQGFTAKDAKKTILWLVHPYVVAGDDSPDVLGTLNLMMDRLSMCPTAAVVSPNENFFPLGNPYNYVVNSYGPITCPMVNTAGEWFHTDLPYYFGCWYEHDPWPETPGLWWDSYRGRGWTPKQLSEIRHPAAEWAIADAWGRRIRVGSGRPGSIPKREYLGTLPYAYSSSPLPSAPYHGVPARVARPTMAWQTTDGILPTIDFDGTTNQAHFDGHVSAFKGNWRDLGDGGTINPYWARWGGNHTTWDCPY